FQVLWGSQVVSEFGLSASTIAFPLLVLAVTGSPGASGLVLSAIAAAHVIAGLPMGALADRWDRKKIMLGCEAAQVISGASLFAAIARGVVTVTHALALVGLTFLRLPPKPDLEAQPEPERHLARETAAGLRWVWGNRSIRVVAFCAVGLNLFFAAYYIVIIVLARGRGVPSGEI